MSSSNDIEATIAALRQDLLSKSEKTQLSLCHELFQLGPSGWAVLVEFLATRQSQNSSQFPNWVDGKAYQLLLQAESLEITDRLQQQWPNGIVPTISERQMDYSLLQQLLAKQDFQAADRLTLQKLCELAGPAASQRKWLYFTEVEGFPTADLQTLDRLWRVYSEGKFGYSVQRELWLAVGKDWEQLWPRINWRSGKTWTRYPDGFTWDLSAPRGHLPLSNQLRGVRVMASLLAHPAWAN